MKSGLSGGKADPTNLRVGQGALGCKVVQKRRWWWWGGRGPRQVEVTLAWGCATCARWLFATAQPQAPAFDTLENYQISIGLFLDYFRFLYRKMRGGDWRMAVAGHGRELGR